jgi:hypothetical protein
MYGASDVPFVAERIFTKKRTVPFWPGFVWFVRGLDGYVTAASVSIIVAVGGWVPLLLNSQAYRDVVAHQLPDTVALFQRIALVGLIVMVYLSFKLLPPRPERYKRSRTIWMLLQWVLMPLTAIGFLSFAALNAQTRLFFAKYLTKFDVTNKATVASREALKRLEELAKKNEMPDYLKKYFEEQAAEKKASDEARTKEREEFKKLVETLTQKNTDQAKTYNEQMEAQSKTIKELQETIQKQAEEAKAKEEAAAKAKAKADHDAKILSKAKELGIPESRINEGFTLSDDATDEAIETYLSKVANNYKALQQPQFGGSYRASEGEPTKEDVDNVAASLVQSL